MNIGQYKFKLRKIYLKLQQKRLKNKDFSLISNTCNGCFILHDLGLRFNSPTVNLWFSSDDFIKFLQNLEHYLEAELVFSDELEKEYGYPVGIIDDINVYFMHYCTREEAKEKWVERSKRVNFDNLFIMMTHKNEKRPDIVEAFEALPYENKVLFSRIKYKGCPSVFRIKGCTDENGQLGLLYKYKGKFSIRKYYDKFPYVKWFNGKIHR